MPLGSFFGVFSLLSLDSESNNLFNSSIFDWL
jgi:hypothetical protein